MLRLISKKVLEKETNKVADLAIDLNGRFSEIVDEYRKDGDREKFIISGLQLVHYSSDNKDIPTSMAISFNIMVLKTMNLIQGFNEKIDISTK